MFIYKPNAWKLYQKGVQKVGHIEGGAIRRIERVFNAARERAGIEDFKFHDLRHTFGSHLVMKGASLKEVQELLGHKDMKMTMRYAHLSQENRKQAVALLNGLCHKTITSSKTAPQPLRLTA